MALDPQQLDQLKQLLFSLVPPDGSAKGNTSLRSEFIQQAQTDRSITVDERDYWTIRDRLLEEHKIETGKGKGGSVHRVPETSEEAVTPPAEPAEAYAREAELFDPFHEIIRKFYVKDYRIKRFVSQVTASQGRRATGGKWTRPDVSLIAVRMYDYLPGKTVEVVTFEVKPAWAYGVDGVYETASHSAFANRSYLAIHVPTDLPANERDRLERECERFGVGLILFSDPNNWDTFEIRIEAKYRTPDPDEANAFIGLQLSETNKEALRGWIL
jgi:hypothetical protein